MAEPLSPRGTGGSLGGRQSFTERVGSLLHHQHSSAGGVGRQASATTGGGACASLDAFRAAVENAGLHLQMSPQMIYAGDYLATLRRFFDARKGHLDAALKMLADCVAWRRLSGADEALSRPLPPEIRALARQVRPSSYIGFDDLNRPIFYERVGYIDHHVLEKSGLTDEQMLEYHCVEMEYMGQRVFAEATERNQGVTVDKLVTIIDTQGLRLSSLTGFVQRLFRAMLAIDGDNYPESCAHIFVVNNSAVFTMLWGVVAPWVDAGTRRKVHVLGSGKAMTAELLKHFRPEQLPSLLTGGKLDYEATRQAWALKIDAAMDAAAAAYAARHAGHAAPEAPASPRLALQERRVLSRRTSSMMRHHHGHLAPGAAAAVVAAADAELASGAHVGTAEARRSSSIGSLGSLGGGGGGGTTGGGGAPGYGAALAAPLSGGVAAPATTPTTSKLPPPFVSLAAATAPPRGAAAGGQDDDGDDDEGWATPRSAMSRASSALSVYYDASAGGEGEGGGEGGGERGQQRRQGTRRRRQGLRLCGGGEQAVDGEELSAQPRCGCVIS